MCESMGTRERARVCVRGRKVNINLLVVFHESYGACFPWLGLCKAVGMPPTLSSLLSLAPLPPNISQLIVSLFGHSQLMKQPSFPPVA